MKIIGQFRVGPRHDLDVVLSTRQLEVGLKIALLGWFKEPDGTEGDPAPIAFTEFEVGHIIDEFGNVRDKIPPFPPRLGDRWVCGFRIFCEDVEVAEELGIESGGMVKKLEEVLFVPSGKSVDLEYEADIDDATLDTDTLDEVEKAFEL